MFVYTPTKCMFACMVLSAGIAMSIQRKSLRSGPTGLRQAGLSALGSISTNEAHAPKNATVFPRMLRGFAARSAKPGTKSHLPKKIMTTTESAKR
jgi:hypothetical protein